MSKRSKSKKSEIPERFLERLQEIFGPSLSVQIQKTFVERPTTFRINTIKSAKEPILELLRENGFQMEQISWYKDAYILKNKSKRELTDLHIYKQGNIYIQSLASMVPPLALDPRQGEKILDLTAAPGSKTSQIAALMRQNGEIVANDNNKIRFFKLKHNMEALGVVDETKSDWKLKLRMEHGVALCKEYPAYFDKILLDAPCSAEARFVANEPKTYGYWHERKIKETAYKQRQLLFSAWQALKSGGILVYSTCTFAPEENEVQIGRLLAATKGNCAILPIEISGLKIAPFLQNWKGKELQKELQSCLRVLPDSRIEGFFIAKLKKK